MDSHEQTVLEIFLKNQGQKLRRSWLWFIKLIKHLSVVWKNQSMLMVTENTMIFYS